MRRIGFVLLLAVALIAAAMFAILLCDKDCRFRAVERNTNLQEMSLNTGLRFPKSAKLVGSRWQQWLEIHITAKIEMDRADLPRFIASVAKPREESRKERPRDLSNDACRARWWNPESSKRFIAIEAYRNYGHFRILVGLDNPRLATIYLKWFTT